MKATNSMVVPLLTSVTVLRGGVATGRLAHLPRGSPLHQSVGQGPVPVVVPDVARRAAAEAVVQPPRRENHGRELRWPALQPRHGPLDGPAEQAGSPTGPPSLGPTTPPHYAGRSLVQLVLRQRRG